MLHRKIPSALMVYNKFHNTYFRYFHGHGRKYGKRVPDNIQPFLEQFVQNDFGKLHYDLRTFESYLLWVFSLHGAIPIIRIGVWIDEYMKEKKESVELKPFSVQMSKYIRDNNIKSWQDYTEAKGTLYPIIIQHYLKEKDFPFEFLLFLKVFDKLPELQKKMLKSVFGREMYNLQERMDVVKKNIQFFREQMMVVNDAFKYTRNAG